jgi:hypothetical protein
MMPLDLLPCIMVWIAVLLVLDAAGLLQKGGKP